MSYNGNSQFGCIIDDPTDRRTVAEIQGKIIKQGKRNVVSRHLHAKNDKETIATWRSDLNRILLIFNVRSVLPALRFLTFHLQTELVMNIHVVVSDIRQDMSKVREEIGGQVCSVSASSGGPIRWWEDSYTCLDTSQVRNHHGSRI